MRNNRMNFRRESIEKKMRYVGQITKDAERESHRDDTMANDKETCRRENRYTNKICHKPIFESKSKKI